MCRTDGGSSVFPENGFGLQGVCTPCSRPHLGLEPRGGSDGFDFQKKLWGQGTHDGQEMSLHKVPKACDPSMYLLGRQRGREGLPLVSELDHLPVPLRYIHKLAMHVKSRQPCCHAPSSPSSMWTVQRWQKVYICRTSPRDSALC